MSMSLSAKDVRPCAGCGKGLAHDGSPMVWRLTVQQFALDPDGIQRRAGLEAMFGGAVALAGVFDPGYTVANALSEPQTCLLCLTCATTLPVAAIEGG